MNESFRLRVTSCSEKLSAEFAFKIGAEIVALRQGNSAYLNERVLVWIENPGSVVCSEAESPVVILSRHGLGEVRKEFNDCIESFQLLILGQKTS